MVNLTQSHRILFVLNDLSWNAIIMNNVTLFAFLFDTEFITTECPPNTYKGDIGPDACVPCPDHSSSPARSTSSAACQCTYGMFKAIPGHKYGTCQEYEHQEQIELGELKFREFMQTICLIKLHRSKIKRY